MSTIVYVRVRIRTYGAGGVPVAQLRDAANQEDILDEAQGEIPFHFRKLV